MTHIFTDAAGRWRSTTPAARPSWGGREMFTHEAGQMAIGPRWLSADPARAWGPHRVPVMLPAPLVPTEGSIA